MLEPFASAVSCLKGEAASAATSGCVPSRSRPSGTGGSSGSAIGTSGSSPAATTASSHTGFSSSSCSSPGPRTVDLEPAGELGARKLALVRDDDRLPVERRVPRKPVRQRSPA